MIESGASAQVAGWPIELLRASTMRLRHRPLHLLPLVELRKSATAPAFYWSSPDGQERIVGAGTAFAVQAKGTDRWRALGEVCAAVTGHLEATAGEVRRPVVRWFVGFAFDDDHGEGPSAGSDSAAVPGQTAAEAAPGAAAPALMVDDWWAPFPAAMAVLPEIMVVEGPRGAYLTVIAPTVLAPPGRSPVNDDTFTPGWIDHGRTLSLLELIESIAQRQRTDAGLDDPFNEPPIPGLPWPRPLRPRDRFREAIAMPDLAIMATLACDADGDPQAALGHRLRQAQRWIARGHAERIVVSLRRCVQLNQRPDGVGMVARLLEQAPDCQVYLFAATPEASLVGASPARLLRAVGRRVSAAALVGSAPRDADRSTDTLIGEALCSSAAELRDCEVVAAGMAQALRSLAPLVRRIRPVPEPRLRQLRHSQHLEVRIEAERRVSLDVLELAARLHPTPAVAGWPRDAALKAIRQIEPCCRGWCGGGLGWLDGKGNGDLALVSSPLLLRRDTALTSAAVGISADSDPQAVGRAIELQLDAALAPFTTPLRDLDEPPADVKTWLWSVRPPGGLPSWWRPGEEA